MEIVNDDILCCNETLMIDSKPNIALKLGEIITFRRINMILLRPAENVWLRVHRSFMHACCTL